MLGLDEVRARVQATVMEGALALDDRVTLAQLEWRLQKHRLLRAAVLALLVGCLMVVALVLLALAVVLQFWDAPQRMTVVWALVCGWLMAWGAALWTLWKVLRAINNGFALTRRELAQDWRDIKERL